MNRGWMLDGTGAVLTALLPGMAVASAIHGIGVLANVSIAIATCAAAEASILKLRGMPVADPLREGSALVTGAILGLTLPAGTDASTLIFACVAALLLGKHVYGGLGANPFNPAMVGYTFVLIALPGLEVDALSGASPLIEIAHRGGSTIEDVWRTENGFGAFGGLGDEWVNVAFLSGGVFLAARRVIDWRVPAGVLAGLSAGAVMFYDGGSSSSLGSPMMHTFTGGTMLAAFFIATDPVTSPAHRRARLWFGLLIGALILTIRGFGAMPDGVAFAVLLGNLAAPWLDRLDSGPAFGSEVSVPGTPRSHGPGTPLRNIAVFVVLSALALLLLTSVARITAGRIALNEQKESYRWLQDLVQDPGIVPTAEELARLHAGEAMPVCSRTHRVRYLLAAGSASGYGGQLRVVIAVTPDGSLLGARTLEQHESPGYTTNVQQTRDLSPARDPSAERVLDALTGATVTANAFDAAIAAARLAAASGAAENCVYAADS